MQEIYKSIFTDCLALSDKNTYLILKPNEYIYSFGFISKFSSKI